MIQLYFIRDVKTKSRYIHPTGTHIFQNVYGLREGKPGAACFSEEQVNKFMAKWEGEEVEKEKLQMP